MAATVEKITASILKSQNMRKATQWSIRSCMFVIMRGGKREDGNSLGGHRGPCFGLRLLPRGAKGHAHYERFRRRRCVRIAAHLTRSQGSEILFMTLRLDMPRLDMPSSEVNSRNETSLLPQCSEPIGTFPTLQL